MDALLATIRSTLDAKNIGFTLVAAPFPRVLVNDVQAVRDIFNTLPWARTRTHSDELAVWIARSNDALVPVVLSQKNTAVPTTFRLATRGMIISFIGPDGSGKSTLVKLVREWLGPLVQSEFYLGHGDPVTRTWQSLARTKNKLLRRDSAIAKPPAKSTSHPIVEVVKRDPIRETIRDSADVARGIRKRNELRKMAAVRRRGEVAVTDRFPHHDVYLCDGPAIRHKSPGPPWRSMLNAVETFTFREFEKIQPDVIFRLRIDAEVAWARKKENTIEEIEAKVDAINGVRFDLTNIVDVPAGDPLPEVLARIKDHLWSLLSTHPQRIEFIGFPASGKSTLAEAVQEQIDVATMSRLERQTKLSRHHQEKTRPRRFLSFGDFARVQARFVRRAIGFGLSVRPLTGDSQRRALMLIREAANTDIWNNQTAQHAPIEIHEQQLFQELFSMTFLRDQFSDQSLRRTIEELRPYMADLIVYVDTPPHESISRMDSRLAQTGPTGDVDKLRAEKKLSVSQLQTWQAALERIVGIAEAKGFDVVRIDGVQPLEAQVRDVVSAIAARRWT